MARTVGIGNQSFESIIIHNDFYVDKTMFIQEWWENRDMVTLITHPPPLWENIADQYG